MVIAGAGLAITAAVALATFVKVIGIGLLGRGRAITEGVPMAHCIAVGLLGIGVARWQPGMPMWLTALGHAAPVAYAADAAERC